MKSKILGLILLLTGLTACKEVQVPNGEIPNEYLSAAQQYVGAYQGAMAQRMGVLQLSLQGNKAILEFTDSSGGHDLIDPRCQSQIGDLLTVQVSDAGGGQYNLQKARFAFAPGNCISIEAKDIELDFSPKGIISIHLLDHQEWREECHMEGGGPGVPPREVCNPVSAAIYIDGRFQHL